MNMHQTYEMKLRAQLEEWNTEFCKLKARADKAEAEKQLEYNKTIAEISLKQKAAREKLEQLHQSVEDGWEDIKIDFENAWLSFGESIKTASSRLK